MVQKQKWQKLSPKKAEILGFLCAEGSYFKYYSDYWEYDKRRNNTYFRKNMMVEGIDFGNNDLELQRRFIELLKKVYDYERIVSGVKTARRVTIRKRLVIADLLRYTKLGCTKWVVPEVIFKSSKKIKSAFLKGYFLGDGSFYNERVTFASVNEKAIKQIQQLLVSLDIKSNLYGPYLEKSARRPIFRLSIIRNFEVFKFIELIGFNIKIPARVA